MLSNLFAGKSIAVVGNARSLLDATHGARIEAHDLVLRMNRGLPEVEASQGRRTDILCLSAYTVVHKVYKAFGADHLIWMSPKMRDTCEITCDFYDLERWQRLHDRLGARPSVGAMVVDMLKVSGAAQVTIFGMDFKRTPTAYMTVPDNSPHDFAAEEALCEETVARMGWTLVRDYATATE